MKALFWYFFMSYMIYGSNETIWVHLYLVQYIKAFTQIANNQKVD